VEHRAHFLILYYPLLGTGGGKISPAYSEGMLKFKREVLTGLLKCLHAGVSWEGRTAERKDSKSLSDYRTPSRVTHCVPTIQKTRVYLAARQTRGLIKSQIELLLELKPVRGNLTCPGRAR
jgi:hypothetical protein